MYPNGCKRCSRSKQRSFALPAPRHPAWFSFRSFIVLVIVLVLVVVDFSVDWTTNPIWGVATREVTREAPAQAELRPTSVLVIVLVDSSVDWTTNPIGGVATREVAREAPAQAELRPTSAFAQESLKGMVRLKIRRSRRLSLSSAK
jgi:hypothetical protein